MTPIYDYSILPNIGFPLSNEAEAPRKYLGGRAVTGEEYATLNISMPDDIKAKALYDFWKDDCNYGTVPFSIALPIFGVTFLTDVPNALLEFIEDISMEKVGIDWTQSIKVKMLEYSELAGYIIDDVSNQLVDDAGNILVSTSIVKSNSSEEIAYG